MGPINYYTPMESPLQAASQGLQYGMGVRQMQAQAQQQQRQQQLQQELTALGQMGGKATYDDYNRIALLLPKEQADSLRSSWEGLNKNQQTSQLQFGGQVFSAVQKDPTLAVQMLNTRAEAERNAGNEPQAKAYETWAKLAEVDPERATQTIGVMLSQLPGGDGIIKNVAGIGAERRAEELHTPALQTAEATAEQKTAEAEATPQRLQLEADMNKAQISNYRSQIGERAKRYNLDVAKFQQETDIKLMELRQAAGKLTPTSEKLMNDSTVASQAAAANAGNLLSLADRMSKTDSGSGLFTSLADRFAKATGNQGEAQQLRQEYTRIRNQNVLSMLPPGPASDRDITIMMSGFPPENADSTHIASFLRGMAKTQRYASISDGIKAEWVSQNGNLRTAKQDMVINGVVIPKGSNVMEVVRNSAETMYDNLYKQGDDDKTYGANASKVSNASYMGFAGAQIQNQ